MRRKFGRGGGNREYPSQVMESCGKRVKEEEDDEEVAKRKKERRVDENEEKLRQSHLRKRKKERPASCEDSGDGSTSEDAIYSEKMSPRFDLINDSLRDNYAKMNNKKPIVEVETVSKKSRKMATMGGSPCVSELKMEGEKGSTKKMFKDFGGIKKILEELDKTVLFPIVNPRPFQTMRVKPPSGILFHGPPGCGKTMLANAIANEAGVPFYPINATDLVSGVSGASEENIRELFSKAYRTAPSIVFIDEIDAIGSKRENQQREMEKRIVTQLLTCMDGPRDGGGFVLVIGATNRPDALDPALRRSGRFEREIALTAPDEDARAEILSVMVQNIGHRLEGPFDKNKIARLTAGFVGADLEGLVYMAGSLAISRVADSRKAALSGNGEDDRAWLWKPWLEEDLEKLYVKMSDFEEAVSVFQGSLTREGFSKVPDVKWDDVGGLELVRDALNNHIIRPIQSPDVFKSFVADLETGFLLYGPPGCGKTLIAKAVANEAGANFIYIKGSELLSKYVGESEGNIRALFQRAHRCSPCVIFFDEVDAITTSLGKDGTTWAVGVLNQLLSELDGGERRNVFVIGATNRPDVIDRALLRPGRFGHLAYVPLPNADQRVSILNAIIAKKKRIDPSVHLDSIAHMCQDFTGADLANLVDKALHLAIDEIFRSVDEFSQDDGTTTVKMTHFEQALSLVSPSVTKQQIKHYEELSKELQGRNGSSFAFQ